MTSVDNRVVQMKFNNSQFESGAQKSIKTLDKLKQALKLEKGTKGMEDVEKKANSMKFDKLAAGVENISQKFTMLGMVAVTALQNIVNKAVDAGERIVSSLTIDPIKMGFQEYETQINAVQTILANTESKGTNLKQVNAALDELNRYADMTIYNFTEMTRNIGTFTAAGVDLDTSVSAIKGIANLAAVSGSTSQQASTAMYQLSQALAAGTVKLMDWNSVVNAGMGGQVFQDALKETARVHGIAIDDMITKEGSFRETLKNGWLSSEVLTETLAKFTGDLTREQLISMGYTDEQAEKIIKMGQTANDAATKVKTFTQLMDTLQEAAQSGWTQSWEIIVGDFEEAKEFLTYLSDTISGVLNEQADARNKVLQGWKDLGGRTMMIEGIKNVFQALGSVITPIGEAFRSVFHQLNEFDLLRVTRQFRDFTQSLILSEEGAAKVKAAFQGFFSVISLGVLVIKSLANGLMTIIKGILPAGDSVLSVGESIGNFLTNLVHDIKVTQAIPETINNVANKIVEIINGIKNVFHNLFNGISDFGAQYGEGVLNILKGILSGIKSVAEGIFGLFTNAVGGATTSVNGLTEAVGFLMSKGAPIFAAFGSVAAHVFQTIGNAISNVVSNLSFERVSEVLNEALFAGILVKLYKFIDGLKEAVPDINGFMDSIKGILEGVQGVLEGYQEKLKAEALFKIATAVGILVASLIALTGVDPDKLATALTALSVAFGELVASLLTLQYAMKVLDLQGAGSVTAMMISMAAAIAILSAAISILGRMDLADLAKGLVGVAVGLAELIGAMKLIKMAKIKKKHILDLRELAVSLVILAAAIKLLGSMDLSELAKGLGAVGVALGEMIAFTTLMSKSKADISLKQASDGIMTIAASMIVLAVAIKMFGSMSLEELAKGLGTVAISLGIMVKALNLMKFEGNASAAAGILVLAAAMNLLIPPILIFGNLPFEVIAKGLGTMAAAFAIFGAAAMILEPLSPVMLSLAVSVGILGAGCLAAGVGVLALSAGLAALSVSGVAGITALVAIISAVIGLIPMIAQQIGVALVTVVTTVASMVGSLVEAIKTIILAILQGIMDIFPSIIETITMVISQILAMIVELAPQLGETLLVLIQTGLEVLTQAIPQLVDAGIQLMLALLQGIADHVGDIVNIVTEFIVNFLNSLSANLQTIIQAAFNFVITFINSLAESFRNNIPTVVEAIVNLGTAIIQGLIDTVLGMFGNVTETFGNLIQAGLDKVSEVGAGLLEIGKNIIQGLIDGIGAMGQAVIDKVTGIVGGAIEAAKNFLGIHSPSKVFMEIGEFCDKGLINGFQNLSGKVAKSSSGVGKEAMNSMQTALGKVEDVLDSDMEYNPTIKPVLDLDDIRKGTKSLNNMFGATNIGVNSYNMAKVAASSKLNSGIEDLKEMVQDIKDASGITFIQNNNSPKALSNADIYRNTRSQLAIARQRLRG